MLSTVFFRLRRLPFAWWAVAIVVSVAVGMTVAQSVGQAEQAADRYRDRALVTVAVRPIAVGEWVQNGDVRTESRPRAFLPKSRFSADPAGRVATLAVAEGDVFTEDKLAPGGLSPLAALLEPGERAVSVPNDEATPHVQVGDRVDAIGSLAAADPVGGEAVLVLSGNGRVIGVSEVATTVAVRADEAPRVAAGVSKGRVSLAVAPVF